MSKLPRLSLTLLYLLSPGEKLVHAADLLIQGDTHYDYLGKRQGPDTFLLCGGGQMKIRANDEVKPTARPCPDTPIPAPFGSEDRPKDHPAQ
jgi:hypothetical protein